VEKITYAVTVKVVGGPTIPLAGALDVDAYEKLDVTVPARAGGADGTADVAVAPGNLDAVRVLIITSSIEDGKLSFKTSANGAADVPVTGPITLIGGGAVSLLGAKPDHLTFTNAAPTAAQVAILVGRKAT
jgi:hypothetical protein